nr:MAG TPA_asm: hypothetical protein [Caudoviricetes sp.]
MQRNQDKVPPKILPLCQFLIGLISIFTDGIGT